jgi:hypothetical protein
MQSFQLLIQYLEAIATFRFKRTVMSLAHTYGIEQSLEDVREEIVSLQFIF